MPLGLIQALGRSIYRRKRTSSLDILTSKRGPRDYYKGKNCKPTGFHTRKAFVDPLLSPFNSKGHLNCGCIFERKKGGYVVVPEKLPNYVVPDLRDFKLKPYVSQCPREVKASEAADSSK